MKEFGHTIHRCTDIQIHWCTGTLIHVRIGIPIQVRTDTHDHVRSRTLYIIRKWGCFRIGEMQKVEVTKPPRLSGD